jgi:type II secretory pathway component PulF
MPTFKCTYREKSGKLVEATQLASDRNSLISKLRENNSFPISIKEVTKVSRKFSITIFRSKDKDVAVFTRQLANMLSSGIDIAKSLSFLVEYSKSPIMKKTVVQIRSEVEGGSPLWEALSHHPQIFSSLYISMVKAGETGENLEQVINNLADYTEKARETKDVINSMLVYPIILLVVGIATAVFIMSFVFPRLSFIFENMEDKSLPMITKMFMTLSVFFSKAWWIMLLLTIGAIVLFINLYKKKNFRLKVDTMIFKIPVLGEMIQKTIFVRFANILGLVLSNGVSIDESMDIACGVVENSYVLKKLSIVKRQIIQGISMSKSLGHADIFSPLMINMIAIGEETGSLDETLLKISKIYEKEIEEQTKRFISFLEPALIFILALGVGFLVTAILLPIFQMNLQIV